MPEGLRIALLGAPSVSSAGAPLRGFVSAKVQALLFYLAVTRRPHSRSALAALLWGDMPESDARANLRVALANLRQIAGPYLSIGRDQIAFASDAHYWLDVDVFQSRLRLLDLPAAGHDDQALQTALDLYRGDFLEGFSLRDAPDFEEWALLQREQMRQIALQALHTLAAGAAERGAYSAGIAFANRLLALDPWREETHRQLMLLLALSGQREAALTQYEACHRVLRVELGVAPLEATTALYERIRAGLLHRPAVAPADAPALAGRADAHARLVQQWERARNGAAGLTLIEGAAGAGKTSLAEAVLGFIAGDGARVLRGRCLRFDAGLPLLPLATALRAGLAADPQAAKRLTPVWRAELARLLPELADQDRAALPVAQDDAARLRLFEAVAQLLVALSGAEQGLPRPLILWLDDLHWADPMSLDVLRFLAERLAGAPFWLLAAARSAQAGWPGGLAALRDALGQEGRLALVRLGPLDEAGIGQLLDRLPVSGQDDHVALASFLGRWTGGNPTLLRALLDDLQGRGLLVGGERGWGLRDRAALAAWEASPRLPDRVRELLLEPVASLRSGVPALLERLAVLGRPCPVALLEQLAADLPDHADALAECLEHRLLIFAPPGSYELAGPLLRLALVQRLAPDQRRRLHALAGTALERLCGPEGPQAQEVARHYSAAGDRLRAFAAAHRAARHSCRGLPWGALRLLIDEGLALEMPAGCVSHPALLSLRGACSAALGDAAAWEADLAALEQQASPTGEHRAGLLLARADQSLCAGASARSTVLAQQGAETALLAEIPGLAAACLRLGALALLEQGETEAAERWGHQADQLDSGEELHWAVLPGQRWPELRCFDRLPALDRLLHGRHAVVLARLEERARQAAGVGDPAVVDALIAAGHIYAALLDTGAALTAYRAALEQTRAAGRSDLSAYLLLCCGRALLADGRPAEAQGHFRASLTLQQCDRQEVLREDTVCGLAACALALGQLAEVQALLAGLRGASADLLLVRTEAAAAAGQMHEVLRLADQLVALGELLGDQDDITPETWWRAGQTLARCGDQSGASRLFAQGDQLLHAHATRLHGADLRLALMARGQTRREQIRNA
ncbi:MAG TPA: AAA family ATPase [Roseiflexaceae bacterium]|nr:AAA family ATPase [Roseiflexaceae bacterium]